LLTLNGWYVNLLLFCTEVAFLVRIFSTISFSIFEELHCDWFSADLSYEHVTLLPIQDASLGVVAGVVAGTKSRVPPS
jgi:hypothetical protein